MAWRIPTQHRGLSRPVVRCYWYLALRTGGELPKSAFEWVECWAQCRAGGDSVLVILGNAKTAAVEELQQIAERHGITLSCEPSIQPALGWTTSLRVCKGGNSS